MVGVCFRVKLAAVDNRARHRRIPVLCLLLRFGGNAMGYECDFVVQGEDGEVMVTGARALNARTLPQAIEWVEEKLKSAPDVFCKANAVRLRLNGKVVWLKVLGVVRS